MSTQAYKTASRGYTMGKNKACSHHAGTGVLGNAPDWTSLHPSPARETRHFGVHVRSAWAWPCAARTKAHAGQCIICRLFQAAASHSAIWAAILFGFCFLGCHAATQVATQLQQTCIQVVCSHKEARKRLTESNGTPAMDPAHIYVVLK